MIDLFKNWAQGPIVHWQTLKKRKIHVSYELKNKKTKSTSMDSTMKNYEHRQLEWVREHECNVGEKYVLPQA